MAFGILANACWEAGRQVGGAGCGITAAANTRHSRGGQRQAPELPAAPAPPQATTARTQHALVIRSEVGKLRPRTPGEHLSDELQRACGAAVGGVGGHGGVRLGLGV